MKISSSQSLAFFAAIGILLLFVFGTEREFSVPVKSINEYDKMMARNAKANTIKQSIVSTLEMVAYKEWAVDSLRLVEQKYESMDSVLIQRLEDIKFEFGYSGMLEKINDDKTAQLSGIVKGSNQNINIEEKKERIINEIDSLKNILSHQRRSLDTLRSLSRYKFYLDQPRFNNE